MNTTQTKIKIVEIVEEGPKHEPRFCRYANLIQKKCPYCFAWVARQGEEIMCERFPLKKCHFKMTGDDLADALKDRFNKFSKGLSYSDITKIKTAMREIKIMI